MEKKKTKIAWICPDGKRSIFQNKLLANEMIRIGWDIMYNECDETCTHIICMSNTQHRRVDELVNRYKIPYITWIMDIVPNPYIMPDWQTYVEHIRNSWRAIALNEAVQSEAQKWTGKYKIDKMLPAIDTEAIKEAKEPKTKENMIVVVGKLWWIKDPMTALYAWDDAKIIPKPKLVFLHKDNGSLKQQMIEEAKKMKGEVFFYEDCDDNFKFEMIKKAKLLIMPCIYGGFNLPPIEAWFCKTPALISKDHHYHTLKDSVFYFDSGDVGDCKKMIEWAYNNNDMFEYEDHQEIMEQFTVRKCARRLERYFIVNRMTKLKEG